MLYSTITALLLPALAVAAPRIIIARQTPFCCTTIENARAQAQGRVESQGPNVDPFTAFVTPSSDLARSESDSLDPKTLICAVGPVLSDGKDVCTQMPNVSCKDAQVINKLLVNCQPPSAPQLNDAQTGTVTKSLGSLSPAKNVAPQDIAGGPSVAGASSVRRRYDPSSPNLPSEQSVPSVAEGPESQRGLPSVSSTPSAPSLHSTPELPKGAPSTSDVSSVTPQTHQAPYLPGPPGRPGLPSIADLPKSGAPSLGSVSEPQVLSADSILAVAQPPQVPSAESAPSLASAPTTPQIPSADPIGAPQLPPKGSIRAAQVPSTNSLPGTPQVPSTDSPPVNAPSTQVPSVPNSEVTGGKSRIPQAGGVVPSAN